MLDNTYPFTVYLRRLANLSGTNRSLFLPRLPSQQFIDLHTMSQFNNEKSFSILESILQGKKKLICPIVDSRMASGNEISKKIRRLQRIDEFLYEERGVKDLHIGWPFVRGKFIEGHAVRCPLLLFPVMLTKEKNYWSVMPRKEAPITFNKFFLLAYSFYNAIPPEESLMDETFEDIPRESVHFRTSLYEMLKKSSLDIHFNTATYQDELDYYQSYSRQEFDLAHESGRLKLFPEAVIGIFPQAGSYLAPDYLMLIKDGGIKNIEHFFEHKQAAYKKSSLSLHEEDIFTGHDQDRWQEDVLKTLKQGQSVIVNGPPGSGKSQLICNVICDAIATGKKVLVVCQKKAALNVVYQRLDELGLGNSVALVHDFKNDRKNVYTQVAKKIDQLESFSAQNNSLDIIQLERHFFQECRSIDRATHELNAFKESLFKTSTCGLSIKELYLRSNPNDHHHLINLDDEYTYFDEAKRTSFVAKLKSYVHYAVRFEGQNYPWKNRKSFASLGIADAKKIRDMLKEIPVITQGIMEKLNKKIHQPLGWKQCSRLLEKPDLLMSLSMLVANNHVHAYFQSIIKNTDPKREIGWFKNSETHVLALCANKNFYKRIPRSRLQALQTALQHAITMCNTLVGTVRWKLFDTHKAFVYEMLKKNALKKNKKGLATLLQMTDIQLTLETYFDRFHHTGFINIPNEYDEVILKQWFTDQKKAIQAYDILLSIPALHRFISSQTTYKNTLSTLQMLCDESVLIASYQATWLTLLTEQQLETIANHPQQVELFQHSLDADFDTLCELDILHESLHEKELKSIKKIIAKMGTWDFHALEKTFSNSLYVAWIHHIETKYPVLRIVSSKKIHLLESSLREALAIKKKKGREMLLLRLREQAVDNLTFNRLNNRVTYRDLYHQVIKKKRIWPLRKLLSSFEEEASKLIPCWMTSPESASAIFPLKELFDIVIFDEASQCFSERGIPAMYRGRQLVIAGDEKQLSPTDLYRVRWSQDDDDPDTEVDSLLDLAKRHIKTLPLKGHYRSKSWSLIDFSNRHFYDGKLRFLPDFDSFIQREPSILYHKVEGLWENNRNKIEAYETVSFVMKLIAQHPEKSIGIVTFNAPQQMMIMDMLEDEMVSQGIIFPDSLIVKNIENIQGDEKDIIVFSIGYGPDKTGKIRVQFGNLNVEKGENRLNVAITRAREKIIVITSLMPHQLHVSNTQNAGPKLMKKYLQYAYDVSQGQFDPSGDYNESIDEGGQLRDHILAWGKDALPHLHFYKNRLPFADLSIHDDKENVMLIFTDDENYHQNSSVKDLHCFTPAWLRKKKWKVMRVYSREYWQNREIFFAEIKKFADRNTT